MKITAAILLLILGFLTIQPAVGIHEKTAGMMCCGKSCEMLEEVSDVVMSCEADNEEALVCEEGTDTEPCQENCDNRGCNPFMSCPFGNFFVMASSQLHVIFPVTPVSTNLYKADEYLSAYLSDCWHPPEIGPVI